MASVMDCTHLPLCPVLDYEPLEDRVHVLFLYPCAMCLVHSEYLVTFQWNLVPRPRSSPEQLLSWPWPCSMLSEPLSPAKPSLVALLPKSSSDSSITLSLYPRQHSDGL